VHLVGFIIRIRRKLDYLIDADWIQYRKCQILDILRKCESYTHARTHTHTKNSEESSDVRTIWRMEWIASTLHTTSENGVSIITTADARTSAASSRLH
jgi:hypothetical protein